MVNVLNLPPLLQVLPSLESHRPSANAYTDNHKPTVNKVEEESTDLEEDATEEDEQDNKLFKIRKRLRI